MEIERLRDRWMADRRALSPSTAADAALSAALARTEALVAESLKAAVHVTITGENTHHMIEACFKGVGRALRQAFRREGAELPSTKGVL